MMPIAHGYPLTLFLTVYFTVVFTPCAFGRGFFIAGIKGAGRGVTPGVPRIVVVECHDNVGRQRANKKD
ncbi:hypothetical protein OUA51_15290 [Edwardsiella ictaluri]|uniref:hypothetical protein n=1 Tax=Edwardsiella ictaluri TaxID=67780 RepID=UPI0037830EA3